MADLLRIKEQIIERLQGGGVAELTPFERVLIEYAVEITLKEIKDNGKQ